MHARTNANAHASGLTHADAVLSWEPIPVVTA
jgi:hypothetical protein